MSENITNAFSFLEKLLSEFSWKRISRLGVILLIVVGIAYLYEDYSGHIRLSRLTKETKLVKELKEIRGIDKLDTDNKLEHVFNEIVEELDSFVSNRLSRSTGLITFWKVFASLVPWGVFFFILNLLNKSKNPEETDTVQAIGGALMIAAPFAFIAAFIPYMNVWVNYVLYPIGHFSIAVFLVMAWANWSKNNSTSD